MCVLWCKDIDRDFVLDTMVVVVIVISNIIARVVIDVAGS